MTVGGKKSELTLRFMEEKINLTKERALQASGVAITAQMGGSGVTRGRGGCYFEGYMWHKESMRALIEMSGRAPEPAKKEKVRRGQNEKERTVPETHKSPANLFVGTSPEKQT